MGTNFRDSIEKEDVRKFFRRILLLLAAGILLALLSNEFPSDYMRSPDRVDSLRSKEIIPTMEEMDSSELSNEEDYLIMEQTMQ